MKFVLQLQNLKFASKVTGDYHERVEEARILHEAACEEMQKISCAADKENRGNIVNRQNAEEEAERAFKSSHNQVFDAIQSYDEVVGGLSEKVKSTTTLLAQERKVLDAIAPKHASLKSEQNAISNERLLSVMRDRKKEVQTNHLDGWANVIQAYWLGKVGREEYSKEKKAWKKLIGKGTKKKKKGGKK